MTTIALGVFMFTFVIVTLVAFLMVARSKLVATGEVSILVNDDPGQGPHCQAGSTLLGTLSANKIFIPSACGGKGSCGVCKVAVTEGGGSMLPTEVSHINRGEEREGVRLACQVKVKGDMNIELPAEIFEVRKWQCTVRSNHNVATFIKELVLELPCGRGRALSGPAATSRSSARPHHQVRRLRHRGRVPGGLGQVRHVALRLHGGGGSHPRLLHGQLPGRRRTSSCSTSGWPHRHPRAPEGHPPESCRLTSST